jgi:hypothetical protein
MMATLKKRQPELQVFGCVMALVLVIFAAIRLIGNSWDVRPQSASQTTVGAASAVSAQQPKERVRYQATIENWRRYRSANTAEVR